MSPFRLYPTGRFFANCIWLKTMMVPMIKTTETVNCKTTNALRGIAANRPALKVPFNTFTGLKEER